MDCLYIYHIVHFLFLFYLFLFLIFIILVLIHLRDFTYSCNETHSLKHQLINLCMPPTKEKIEGISG